MKPRAFDPDLHWTTAGYDFGLATAARSRSFAIIAVFGRLGAIVLLPFVEARAPASWPFMAASAAILVSYCFALVRA